MYQTDIQPSRLKQLLQRLVDIYSPSGKENDILDFLKGYLNREWIPVITQIVDEKRYNILILPETDDIRLAFMGHLDTVSAYELENYGYSEEDDLISGLGTADMKGGCAAILEAYMAFREKRGVYPPVAICLVVGEEETGDGAEKLIKEYHFPWTIIAEPTNLIPCLSSYGYAEVQIATQGKRMHASLANRRENAIEAMLHTMLRISHYMESQRPELVYNIRDLHSMHAGFAVPERCEAWLDVHLPPDIPIRDIITELKKVSIGNSPESSLKKKNKTRAVQTFFYTATIDSGYQISENGWIIEAIKAVYANHALLWQTTPFRSHSDANQLWAAGIKPIVLGPGQLEKAHTQDESVSFCQVCLAAEIYLEIMLQIE